MGAANEEPRRSPVGSTGDFQEVLTALLGKDAPNLSPPVIARLKGATSKRGSPE
jgi:hypothetical protein